VSQTTLPVAGGDCDFGGVRVASGTDADANGVLAAGEETSVDLVCNGSDALAVNTAVKSVFTGLGISADPTTGRTLSDIDAALPQLGMKLFFTKCLGGDQDSACVTCHHPVLGGSDDKTRQVGVGAEIDDLLGPGRRHSSGSPHFDGGPTVPRNSPTTFNVAMWDSVLFHDGRVQALTPAPLASGTVGGIRTPDSAFGVADPAATGSLVDAQARFPVTSPEEMRGFAFEAGNTNDAVRAHLEDRLQGDVAELPANQRLPAFRTGYASPSGTADTLITFPNITRAIAAYESSQVFVDTPVKRFIAGDDSALSGDAKLGALLFYGEAGCGGCHSGNFFTDEAFHVVSMPQVGRGKGNNGVNGNDDFGRFRESGVEADRYAFRTPSLINTAVTGPWGHAGTYETLEVVVRHHIDPRTAIQNFDFNQLEPGVQAEDMVVNTGFALDKLDALRAAGESTLPVVTSLDDTDIARLVSFLGALTDPCVEDRQCLSQWIPNSADQDPDTLRVTATDRTGAAL
jgi:cytochrome c peroxidase